MNHPSVLELLSLATGTASPPYQRRVEQHVATCTACRRIVSLHAPLAAEVEASAGEDTALATPDASSSTKDLLELPIVDRGLYSQWEELEHGQGGMGRTLRAWDRRLGRTVAIKELLPPTAADGQTRDSTAYAHLYRRFEREARLTARLDHPSIVSVHEAGQWPDGEPFYAMRLVRGAPLDRAIQQRATVAERLELLPNLTAAADAIAYAHDQAIVHRDIKPANILLGPFGETVVIDWGIAKDLRATSAADSALPIGVYRAAGDGLTQVGIGTPQYMPPEQARGQNPNPTFDVYALGATLYHVILGAPPYGNSSPSDVRKRLLREAAPPLRQLVPEAPPELCDIVDKAMAREPSERFQSALELAEELRRFQTGQLTKTRRHTLSELLARWGRRHRAVLRIAAIAMGALVVVGSLSLARVLQERTRAEQSERRAQRELQKALGQTASQLAMRPERRLDATALGVRAVGQGAALGGTEPEALQGLVDALAAGPLLTTLRGHRGAVRGFAALSDGSALVTSSTDRTLRLWDPRSGLLIETLPTSITSPDHVRASADAHYLLAFGPCDDAELWNLQTRASVRLACRDEVPGAGFTPEGQHVITADADAVTAWGLATATATRRLPIDHKASALGVASTRATPYAVAVGLMNGALILWDDRTGASEQLVGHTSEIRHAFFTEDSRGLVSADATGKVVRWDLGTRPPQPTLLRDDPTTPATLTGALAGDHLALLTPRGTRLLDVTQARLSRKLLTGDGFGFSPLGDSLYGVTSDGVLHTWDTTTGSELRRYAGPTDAADAVLAFSRGEGSERLAVAGRNGAAYLWDRREGVSTGSLVGHTSEITWASWTTHGDLLTASLDGTARRWGLTSGRADHVFTAPTELLTASASRDGREIAAGGLDGVAYLFDWSDQVHSLGEAEAPVTRVAFSPDGQGLLTASLDGTTTLWGLSALKPLQWLDPGDESIGLDTPLQGAATVTAAAYRPDGQFVVTGYADGSTRLRSATSGVLVAVLPSQEPEARAGVASVFFSPDGALVLVGLGSGGSLLCNGADLTPLTQLEGRSASSDASPFSPDGQEIATVVGDGRVVMSRVDQARPPTELDGRSGLILSTVFSPKGDRLVTAAIDGIVRLWDLKTQTNLLSVASVGEGEATWASLSPDERWLVTAYASGALRLHPASAESALERGCETLTYFGRAADAEGGCPPPRP
jgi:WD40 repeat protein